MEIFKSRDTHQRGRGGPPLSSAIFLLGGIYFPGVCFFNTLVRVCDFLFTKKFTYTVLFEKPFMYSR